MKLLLDQNISPRLAKTIAGDYPGSSHVREINLHEADDAVIWEFALANGYVIVSKDGDFHQRSFLHGHPPKFIWIRLGNCSTEDIQRLLKENVDLAERFHEDSAAAFMILG